MLKNTIIRTSIALAIISGSLASCAPKTCRHSSICKCHNKDKRKKSGMDEITSRQAFPQAGGATKSRWYKGNAGLKKDRNKRKSREKF